MRSLSIFFMTIFFGVLSTPAFANNCTNSGENENAEMVEAWAKVVGKTAGAAAKLVEEMPMTEAALEVTEITAEVTELVAESFANHAMGSPKPTEIPWQDISSSPKFWAVSDEDTIYMTKKRGTGQLIFQQTNLTWWKGIVTFNKTNTNSWMEIACLQDDNNSMTLTINPSIAHDQWISLSKAKTAGVHTNMYLITNWAEASPAYDYVFNWVKD